MALSSTSLNPSYLMRIKAAVLRAVVKSHKPQARRGIGLEPVYNRRGKSSLQVVARRGGGFEIFDETDRDVTDMIVSALRAFHTQGGLTK